MITAKLSHREALEPLSVNDLTKILIKMKVTVAGMITDPSFHKSVAIAKALEKSHNLKVECC